MGYACPVCGDPQMDGRHLANHLAFTALLGDDPHEAWLDDHVPEWGTADEVTLADAVVERAEPVEFPQVFEDTVGGSDEMDDPPAERSGALFADDDHDHRHTVDQPRGPAVRDLDEETQAILEEARAMTREMHGVDDDTTDDTDSDPPVDGDGE